MREAPEACGCCWEPGGLAADGADRRALSFRLAPGASVRCRRPLAHASGKRALGQVIQPVAPCGPEAWDCFVLVNRTRSLAKSRMSLPQRSGHRGQILLCWGPPRALWAVEQRP